MLQAEKISSAPLQYYFNELSFKMIETDLKKIEGNVKDTTTPTEIYEQLRCLGLDDFGMFLFSLPNLEYPKISNCLPRMASEDVQKSWTGASGKILLMQSLDFIRSVSSNFCKYTGEPLQNKSILDFGCGYGRIARLMYYYTNPSNFYGVDPWDKSIEICHADGLTENFLLSDYLPSSLPVVKKTFSLIYAFSVFTHLSERATIVCLNTLLAHLESNGVIVITIRPIEYWRDILGDRSPETVSQQMEIHQRKGFSFFPHNRIPTDGDITYGDTSMTIEWLENSFPNIDILGIDRSLNDPYQFYIFLRNK